MEQFPLVVKKSILALIENYEYNPQNKTLLCSMAGVSCFLHWIACLYYSLPQIMTNLLDNYVEIYSPMYCKEPRLCHCCYPDVYRKKIGKATNVGIISADAIGERGSQLTMRQLM